MHSYPMWINEAAGISPQPWDHLTDSNQWFLLNDANSVLQFNRHPQVLLVPPSLEQLAQEFLNTIPSPEPYRVFTRGCAEEVATPKETPVKSFREFVLFKGDK